MKVAHFTGPKKLEIVDLPMPRLNRPDAVLLRIDRVGVCGSDVHYYTDGRIGDQVLVYPATLGHECAGTVVEVGAEVAHLRPGQRVAVDPAMVCGTCDQCRAGTNEHLPQPAIHGLAGRGPRRRGRVSRRARRQLLSHSRAMTLDEAALVEPLSVGLHAVRLAEVSPAARIAILGAGPIGLSVLLCAKAAGPVHRLRDRSVGRAAGSRAAMRRRLDRQRQARRGHGGDPAGAAVAASTWCSSVPATRCASTRRRRLLTPGGTLMLVGIPPTDRVIFDIHRMRRKELTFQKRPPAAGLRRSGDRDDGRGPDRRAAIAHPSLPAGASRRGVRVWWPATATG